MDDKQEFDYLQKLWFNQIDKVDSSNIIKCPICLEGIINKKVTTCNHSFCECCIDKWLETNNTCPSCRTILIISETTFSTFTPSNFPQPTFTQPIPTYVSESRTFVFSTSTSRFEPMYAYDSYIYHSSAPKLSVLKPSREVKKSNYSRNALIKCNIIVNKKNTNRKYR